MNHFLLIKGSAHDYGAANLRGFSLFLKYKF